MSKRIGSQRFRQRKLSVKQSLPIFREKDVGAFFDDDSATQNIPRVVTGVEKAEEVEHHLQAVISASKAEGGKTENVYIPTPETTVSSLQYDSQYTLRLKQPKTYIKFSSTLEDCVGPLYCMDEEDEEFLTSYNAGRPSAELCSEDQFELVMDAMEETTKVKQPFASLDPSTPPLSLEELESGFEEMPDNVRKFIPKIYDHWKSRRIAVGNSGIMPSVKFERNETVDEMDPYVCFRRREIRQMRKTRGRDAQVGDKLKKFRNELELARQLVYFVAVRESTKKDQISNEQAIFEQRHSLREVMRSLGVKDGDMDLLIDQPLPKPPAQTNKPAKAMAEQAAIQPTKQAIASRQPVQRPTEPDMVLYSDIVAKRNQQVDMFVRESIDKHRAWNDGYLDLTWRPITPPHEPESPSLVPFCSATITDLFLPTPPLSISSVRDKHSDDNVDQDIPPALTPISGPITPEYPKEDEWQLPNISGDFLNLNGTGSRMIYRRRIARGGRMLIDRKLIYAPENEVGYEGRPIGADQNGRADERVLDRFRYDNDSDDDDINVLGHNVQYIDPYSANSIKYRALMGASMARDLATAQMQLQQAQARQQQQQQQQLLLQQQQQQQQQRLQTMQTQTGSRMAIAPSSAPSPITPLTGSTSGKVISIPVQTNGTVAGPSSVSVGQGGGSG